MDESQIGIGYRVNVNTQIMGSALFGRLHSLFVRPNVA